MNKNIINFIALFCFTSIMMSCTSVSEPTFDMDKYLSLGVEESFYPTPEQIAMLDAVLPQETYTPAPDYTDRAYWMRIAALPSGKAYLDKAVEELGKAPEVPITDEVYRRANREGNRGIYKPRYYRTMDRLERFIIAECLENKGRFVPQVEVYMDSIMAMKSWLHPNHDDDENGVLEGRRVGIDLGARKFGLVLAMGDALLQDKISPAHRERVAKQLHWRITESYLQSAKGPRAEDGESNGWLNTKSNWNSVCNSGTVFATIVSSKDRMERIATVGTSLNSTVYYLSGFGADGYCSEGTGYWNYGFSHYFYLAEILYDYTDGMIDLYKFNTPEKLENIANFPENFQIQNGLYAPFSDGVTRVKEGNDNFAYVMAAKHYGARKPSYYCVDEGVMQLVLWNEKESYICGASEDTKQPKYTYFDDFGVVISRGQQTENPFSISIKAGHNSENHNHNDVGTYVIVMGDDIISGDIGAPSYTAGSFSKDNPARTSWGHPVPRVNNTLQSKGRTFSGKVLSTSFTDTKDEATMDLLAAYEVSALTTLTRSMTNDKSGKGIITVTDHFEASQAVEFGTAIMVNVAYEIIDNKTIILTSENQRVKVEISSEMGEVKLKDELVPVQHLRSGKLSYRIGVDFLQPLTSGSIQVKYTPLS